MYVSNFKHARNDILRIIVKMYLNFKASNFLIEIFTYMKWYLSTATHDFKWVKITRIWLIWDQTIANIDV